MSPGSALRYLQGERPGLSAGSPPPREVETLIAILYPDSYYFSTITIQQLVQLADVSYYQEEISFIRMKAAGIAGVIVRAGQRYWVDIRFQENWRRAKEAGLPRGTYWLYDSREDPGAQAALWWSLVQGDPAELVYAADFEENYKGPYGRREHFKAFLTEFQRLSGARDEQIVIYTGFFWWLERVGDDPFFARYALWLAWYAAMSVVRVPPPWSQADLIFWQYTSSGDGPFYGVSSLEIDLNWFCCSEIAFTNRFRLGAPAPGDGGTMPKYYKWTANGANIRTGPAAGYPDKGDLVNGDVIQVDDSKSGGWFPFKIAQHSDGSFVTLADSTPLDGRQPTTYWVTDAYFVEVSALPGPLPTDPEPDPETPPAQEETVITQTFTPPPGYSVASTVSGNTVTTVIKPEP